MGPTFKVTLTFSLLKQQGQQPRGSFNLYGFNMIMMITGLPGSMPNADQNHGIDPKCLSMPINSSQCRIKASVKLIRVDRH